MTEIRRTQNAALATGALLLLASEDRIPEHWDVTLYYYIEPDASEAGMTYDADWVALYRKMLEVVGDKREFLDSLKLYLKSAAARSVDGSGYHANVAHWVQAPGAYVRFQLAIDSLQSNDWSPEAKVLLTGYMARAVGRGNMGIRIIRIAGDDVAVRVAEGDVLGKSDAETPDDFAYLDWYGPEREINSFPLSRFHLYDPTATPEKPTSWVYVLRLEPERQTISLRQLMSGAAVKLCLSQSLRVDPPPDSKASIQLHLLSDPFMLELYFFWDGNRRLAFEGWAKSGDGRKTYAKIVTRHDALIPPNEGSCRRSTATHRKETQE